jgi:hypothetical protein
MQRVLLLLLCFCSFLAAANDTALKLYRPFGEVVDQSSPIVKKIVSGECFAPSQLIVREDAWRCMAENKVYDPCFVKWVGKKTEAVCPQSPWMSDSVQIEVTAPLNNEHHKSLDMSQNFPWAVELANGEHCQAVESKEEFDSMPIRYRCSNQNVLIGYLQRCKPVWSMLEKTPDGVITADFSRAWF